VSLFLANCSSSTPPEAAGGGDPVADFLTATGIVDGTIEGALQDLYDDLVAAGIWDKCHAIYPFVGGTSTTHKYNFKDARDLDAAFRLTFSGTVTHDANGITPNGTNGYADTKYIDSTHGTINDAHLSVYSRSSGQDDGRAIGAAEGSDRGSRIGCRSTSNTFGAKIQSTGAGDAVSTSDGNGLFVASRTDSSGIRMQVRGVSSDKLENSSNRSSVSFYIGAFNNNGTAANFSSQNLAFVSIGTGLTQTEAGDLDTAVVAFQTALSRNV
jgi:hypothetical protein